MSHTYKQITRTILTLPGIAMKMIVTLNNPDKDPYFVDRSFELSSGEIQHNLSLNYFPMISIEMVSKNKSWDRSRSIIITSKNRHVILKALKKVIDILYDDDIFYYVGDSLKMYALDKKQIIKVYNAGNSNGLIITPAVITDSEGKEYEGATMFFNRTDNFVDISSDELESLYDNLKQIDLFLYSQSLINYYISYIDKVEPTKPIKRNKPLFEIAPTPPVESSVTGTVIKPVEDPFAGL